MSRRVVAGALVVALVLAASALVLGRDDSRHLTATFARTVSLYEGARVKVLGVDVGRVDEIRVVGTAVEAQISYDSDIELPRDVHALVVAPSIVGDRFVQLAPAYVDGPVLADGATLGLDRTGVPLELDDTYRSLGDLAQALGPQGANADGALSRLVSAAAQSLEGNGSTFNATVRDLSDALAVLADGSDDIDATITNLARTSETLAGNDTQLRTVVTLLASVGSELAGQRTEMVGAVRTLRTALDKVGGFLRTHRPELRRALKRTDEVASVLSRRTDDLARLVDLMPVGLTHLVNLYAPRNWDPSRPGDVPVDGRTGSGALRDDVFDGLEVQLSFLLSAVCDQLPPAERRQLQPFCGALQEAGGSIGRLIAGLSERGSAQ
ncbi:MAG TPA: MCE family protein [Nocardioidaceae bacterium]|nr:MCE family protein [Nocardioidaceae bacterium]